MILVIDHYDSFIDMICDYLLQLGYSYQMLKTDQLTPGLLTAIKPSHLLIGPGPGHPEDAALSGAYRLLAAAIDSKIPVLGICLGHQMIARHYGAEISRADFISHGVIDRIEHTETEIFTKLPSPLCVTRYHSLLVARLNPQSPLKVIATSARGEIMAIAHTHLPVYGVQFHPESVMTEYGLELFANFLQKPSETS